MNRDELAAHLDYMRELGVQGVSRAAEWRTRVETPRPAGAEVTAVDETVFVTPQTRKRVLFDRDGQTIRT